MTFYRFCAGQDAVLAAEDGAGRAGDRGAAADGVLLGRGAGASRSPPLRPVPPHARRQAPAATATHTRHLR